MQRFRPSSMNNVGGLIALTVTHRAKLSAFFSQSRAEGERERFEVTRIEAERSQPFHRANNASMYVYIVRAPRVEIFSVGWKQPWNELISNKNFRNNSNRYLFNFSTILQKFRIFLSLNVMESYLYIIYYILFIYLYIIYYLTRRN